ncbi:MAG: hypothetical protein IJA79_03945 [Desulfovibrio sp.]|nr:hypothetical protein [Desulfovibrio sp.]
MSAEAVPARQQAQWSSPGSKARIAGEGDLGAEAPWTGNPWTYRATGFLFVKSPIIAPLLASLSRLAAKGYFFMAFCGGRG